LIWKRCLAALRPRRRAVARGDGAQPHEVVVGAVVAHDADGPHGQEHRKGLPDRVVEAGATDLVDIDLSVYCLATLKHRYEFRDLAHSGL